MDESPTHEFKLDSRSLPKLEADGANYLDWAAAWKRAFRYGGLADIIDGSKARPNAAAVAERAAFDRRDDKAMVMLISVVHQDLTTRIVSAPSAAAAWKILSDRFDRDTGNAIIYLFRALTNLRLEDGGDILEHVDTFRQLWTKLFTRTSTSSKPVGTAMKAIFESDEVKGSMFLTTLPESMDHVVDNLSSQNLSSFSQIEPKMLDIASRNQAENESLRRSLLLNDRRLNPTLPKPPTKNARGA